LILRLSWEKFAANVAENLFTVLVAVRAPESGFRQKAGHRYWKWAGHRASVQYPDFDARLFTFENLFHSRERRKNR
jgi:hypothetical protein